MGAKSKIVKGRNGMPLAGAVDSLYLDPSAVTHLKVINSGKTIVLFLRGWQPPVHVHCAEVAAVIAKEHCSEAELICEIVRTMQSSQNMYLRVCGYARGRIVQIVDYNPQFCENNGQRFCVTVARGTPGGERGRGEPLYQQRSVTIWHL